MNLQIAEDPGHLLRSEDQTVEQAVREISVLDLFRQRRIPGGRAAELLGITREEFIDLAARHDILYFNLTPEVS